MAIGLGVVVLGERLGRRGWLACSVRRGCGSESTLLEGFLLAWLLAPALLYALVRKRLDMEPFRDGDRITDDRATGSGANHLHDLTGNQLVLLFS